jgi:hypothetical protein
VVTYFGGKSDVLRLSRREKEHLELKVQPDFSFGKCEENLRLKFEVIR